MAITKQSGPTFRVNVNNHGDILELGPASVGGVGTLVAEFLPSGDWIGSFAVLGKILGEAARLAGASFKPVPYRLVNRGNAAASYEMISDLVSDSSTIQVPANGFSIGLLTACTQGYMDVCVYRMDGPSAV